MRKASANRLFTFVLSFLLAFSTLPVQALAEAVEEVVPQEEVSEPLEAGELADPAAVEDALELEAQLSAPDGVVELEEYVPGDDGVSSEVLATRYAEQQLLAALPEDASASEPPLLRSSGYNLSTYERRVLDQLKPMVAAVAAGERSSTVFDIDTVELFGQEYWTADDLGVDYIWDDSGFNEAAISAFDEMTLINQGAVIDVLLADCPFELYWYQKTEDTHFLKSYSGTFDDNGEQAMCFTGNKISFYLPVDTAYATGEQTAVPGSDPVVYMLATVSTLNGQRVNGAVANAQLIVSGASGTPYEMLEYFKQQICDRVEYDHDAADGNADDGDPWQIINVFDDDENTNVVCEGYSKAFKYLCDLAGISGVDCILASGTMSGGTGEGPHMWNIVNMDDGYNYLVDVTNCDEGSIGNPDLLFMVPPASGEIEEGYAFTCDGESISYAYDSDTRSTFTDADLTLSGTPYEAPDIPAGGRYFVDASGNRYLYFPVTIESGEGLHVYPYSYVGTEQEVGDSLISVDDQLWVNSELGSFQTTMVPTANGIDVGNVTYSYVGASDVETESLYVSWRTTESSFIDGEEVEFQVPVYEVPNMRTPLTVTVETVDLSEPITCWDQDGGEHACYLIENPTANVWCSIFSRDEEWGSEAAGTTLTFERESGLSGEYLRFFASDTGFRFSVETQEVLKEIDTVSYSVDGGEAIELTPLEGIEFDGKPVYEVPPVEGVAKIDVTLRNAYTIDETGTLHAEDGRTAYLLSYHPAEDAAIISNIQASTGSNDWPVSEQGNNFATDWHDFYLWDGAGYSAYLRIKDGVAVDSVSLSPASAGEARLAPDGMTILVSLSAPAELQVTTVPANMLRGGTETLAFSDDAWTKVSDLQLNVEEADWDLFETVRGMIEDLDYHYAPSYPKSIYLTDGGGPVDPTEAGIANAQVTFSTALMGQCETDQVKYFLYNPETETLTELEATVNVNYEETYAEGATVTHFSIKIDSTLGELTSGYIVSAIYNANKHAVDLDWYPWKLWTDNEQDVDLFKGISFEVVNSPISRDEEELDEFSADLRAELEANDIPTSSLEWDESVLRLIDSTSGNEQYVDLTSPEYADLASTNVTLTYELEGEMVQRSDSVFFVSYDPASNSFALLDSVVDLDEDGNPVSLSITGTVGSLLGSEIIVVQLPEAVDPAEMKLDELAEITIGDDPYWVGSFTAPEDGNYLFFTEGYSDTYGELFSDAELGNQIDENDNGGEVYNFRILHWVSKGQTVFLKVRNFSGGWEPFSVGVKIYDPFDLSEGVILLNRWKFIATDMPAALKARVEDGSSTVLTKDVDYILEFMDADGTVLAEVPSNPGEYYVHAVPAGDSLYTGETDSAWFKIYAPNDLGAGSIRCDKLNYASTGSTVELGETVTDAAGNQLVEGNDYTLEFFTFPADYYGIPEGTPIDGAPSEPGNYLVRAVALDGGSYIGCTDKAEFHILDTHQLYYATITLGTDDPACTGEPVELGVTVIDFAGNTLAEGTDYVLRYWDVMGEGYDGVPADPGDYYVSAIPASGSAYVGETERQSFRIYEAIDLPVSGTWGSCPWTIDEDGVLTVYPGVGATQEGADDSPWSEYSRAITSIIFEADGDRMVVAPENISRLFSLLTKVATIDVSGFDTSNATDMRGMFTLCESLTKLDLSGLDTSNVTDMSSMFWGCARLSEINLSGWDTSSVANMSSMFGRSGVSSIDFSGWNTANVTDMNNMFLETELTELDLSGWNVSSVTDMHNMFLWCDSLVSLNLSGWNTSSVTDMNAMFRECTKLSLLDVSGWNTSSVMNLDYLFYACPSIITLDLSSWDTSSVTNMFYMFACPGELGVPALVTVYVGDGWSTAALGGTNNSMFGGCINLVGGNGTAYDYEHIDAEYARIDAPGTPGYFTAKSAGKIDISDAEISGLPEVISWTGEPLRPDFTVILDGVQLSKDVDYTVSYTNNVNTSNSTGEPAVVTVTGIGAYTGTAQAGFYIDAADLLEADITLSGSNFTFSGSAIKPDVTVVWHGKELVEGTDYTVEYGNNVNASSNTSQGYAEAVVRGIGNYMNTTTLTFSISPASVSAAIQHSSVTVDYVPGVNPIPQGLGLAFSGQALAEGADYTVSYGDIEYADQPYRTASITGVGNYQGTGSMTVNITPYAVDAADVTFGAIAGQNYTGRPVKPKVTVLLNGAELDAQFYTCSYSNNVEPGNAAVNVTFQGLYSGSASTTFVILNERASGTWGTCPWEITADGVLMVHPGIGENVYGAEDAPWKSYVGNITSVVFADGVVAPESLDGLLSGIYEATSIDVSSLDTSAVTSMRSLFDGCFAVETLDISGWNTANVTDMTRLFYGCSNLVSLNVSGWNTSSVTNMDSMFSGCFYLASIGVSRWNTSSVTNMQYMFNWCIAVSSFDLTGWDTSNLTNTDGMFRGCSKLETIYVGEGWSTESITSSDEMFIDCTLLVGGCDTPYDSAHVNAEYARVDAIGSPGYLTAVTTPPSKIDINNATVTGVNGSYVFAGDPDGIEPVPVVTYQGRTLVKGVDYEVAYLDNVYAGRTYGEGHSAFVVISGKGNFAEGEFTGFKYVEFFIEPAQASSATVEAIPDQVYAGSPITPAVTVTIGETTLEEGNDYTVSFANNDKPGVATVTITGTNTGNLTGSTTAEFVISEPMDNVLYGLVEVDGEEVESTYELRYGNSNASAFEGVTFHVHNYYEDSPLDYDLVDSISNACYEASGLSGLRSNEAVEHLWLEDTNGNEIDVNSAGIGNVHVQMVTNIGGDNDPNRMAIVHYDRETGVATKLDSVSIEEEGPFTDPETGEQYSLFVITYEGTLADVMGDVALVCTNDHIDFSDDSGVVHPFYQLTLIADEHAPIVFPTDGTIDGESYDFSAGGIARVVYTTYGSEELLAFDSMRDIYFFVPLEMGYVLDSVTYAVGNGESIQLDPSGSIYTDWNGADHDLYVIPAVEDVVTISVTAHKGYVVNDNGTVTFEPATGLPSTAYKLNLDLATGANVIAEDTYSSPSSRAALVVENASGDVDYYLWSDMPTYVTPYPSNEYRLVGEPTFTPSGAAITSTDEFGSFMVSLTAPATMRVEAVLLDYVNADEDASTGVTVDVPEDIAEQYEELTLVVEPETEVDAIEAAKIVIAENAGDDFSPDELVMYDIHYEDADGEEVVAPTDESGDVMRVTLPVPDGWKASQTHVYYMWSYTRDDGVTDTIPIDLGAIPTIDGKSMVFYTSHFSDYAMALDMDAVPVKIDLSTAVIAPIPNKTYAGKEVELKPEEIIVTLDGLELAAQVDYTVTYEYNDKPGTATLIVKGTGNFKGKTKTTFKIVEPAAPFFLDADPADARNHGAEVDWMGRFEISTGWEVTGGREFRGMLPVTRCDFAAFLYRMYDLADDGARNDSIKLADEKVAEVLEGVSDCDLGTYHAADIAWMIDSGISRGWGNGDGTVSFRPYENVARQDMAAFLYRFADHFDDRELDGSPAPGMEGVSFSDVRHGDSANHAAEVEWLASVGVTVGWGPMADGRYEFRGTRSVARQDMAAFMYRLYAYLQRQG